MSYTIDRILSAVVVVASFTALAWAAAGVAAGIAMGATTAFALALQEGALDRKGKRSQIAGGRAPHVRPGAFAVHVAQARTWS